MAFFFREVNNDWWENMDISTLSKEVNSNRDPNGLRFEYPYVIFDLSVLLYSSMFALARGNKLKVKGKDILRLVIQKTFKPIREWMNEGYLLGTKKIIFVHDKRGKDGKYIKERAVDEYKTDRSYGSDDEIETLSELIKPECELCIEDILEIKDQIRELELKGENFYTANMAKYTMKSELENSMIHQMLVPGYEADDLFYSIGNWLQQHGEYGLGISTDKDWVYKTNDNLDFYSTKYDNMYPELKDEWRYFNEQLKGFHNVNGDTIQLDLYSFGVLNELCNTSHNGVTTYLEEHPDVTFYDFVTKLFTGDKSLPEYDKYLQRYYAMNMELSNYHDYPTELSFETNKLMNQPTDYDALLNFITANDLNVGDACLNTIKTLVTIQNIRNGN